MQTTPTIPGHHEVGLDAVLERSRKKGKKLKRLSSGPREAAFQTALKGSYDYNYIQWYEISESVSRSVVSASLGAPQAPLSMEFSRQECWSGLPCRFPGDLLKPGIKPRSPALQADSLSSEPPVYIVHIYIERESAYIYMHIYRECIYIYIYIYIYLLIIGNVSYIS